MPIYNSKNRAAAEKEKILSKGKVPVGIPGVSIPGFSPNGKVRTKPGDLSYQDILYKTY